ncbi:MAG: hypothetical protein WAT23_06150 [Chromatiaceae bacterium]
MLTCADPSPTLLPALLARFGLSLGWVAPGEPIPGSYWGESEAGLVGDHLYVRADTPIHSALHEACHWICMNQTRRAALHTDAGGEVAEENGVCYLQILLADELAGVGRKRLCYDMDDWGYSFRLGGARIWFEEDAEDARQWLLHQGLIDTSNRPTWTTRS